MRRSIITRGRRVNTNKDQELDITSLLDVLTILLVFLLQNYNASGIVVNVPEDIKVPTSSSESLNERGVTIQVSPSKIWVDDELILDINSSTRPSRLYDHGNRRIIPLFDKLLRIKEDADILAKTTMKTKSFSAMANLVIDKSIKYNEIQRILYTCAEAGFIKYKFVVLSENG